MVTLGLYNISDTAGVIDCGHQEEAGLLIHNGAGDAVGEGYAWHPYRLQENFVYFFPQI